MGYTHYYYLPAEIDQDTFDAAVADIQKVAEASGVPLGDWEGEGSPEFTRDTIGLNGVGDEGHETFRVDRVYQSPYPGREPMTDDDGRVFHFCKTARKPYDVVVAAALIALKHRLGEAVHVSSDGNDEEWAEGKALAQSALGFGDDYAIQRRGDEKGLWPVEQEVGAE